MTGRERFAGIMSFRPVDRLPAMQVEPFEKPAVERWRGEGLPADRAPEDYLGLEQVLYVGGAGIYPDPPFEVRVLSEEAGYRTETTALGATVRRRIDFPTTFYGHLDHPIRTRRDWDLYRQRLRTGTPGRLRADLTPEAIRAFNESPRPVGLSFFPFFFRLGFYTMGMERFLTAFYEEPDLVREMFAAAGELLVEALRPVLGVIRVDFAQFTEDLAGKNGPLVSPRTYREFWSPWQVPLLRLLRDHRVPVIAHWSAGKLEPLLPEIMAQGFNCIGPLERLAGMDPLEVRRRHGRGLLLMGGISKEALLAGPAAIDREIERLLPLVREGGFIPMLDDMVPAECPLGHYRHLVEAIRGIRTG